MSDAFDARRRGLEEEYIRRQDREALDKIRRKLAEEAAAKGQPAHSCPLGHGALTEVKHEEIIVDRCDTCGGVWLDAGELELLTEREGNSWFARIMGK